MQIWKMGRARARRASQRLSCACLEPRVLLSYSPIGPEIPVGTASSAEPAVAADSAGDFVVAWSATNGANGLDIFAQRYLAGGTPLGSPFVVNTGTSGDQNDPTIAMNASGDFVIGWSSVYSSYNSTYFLYCQAFSPNGTPVGSQVLVTPVNVTTSPMGPQLAMAPDGGFEAASVTVSGNVSTLAIQRYTSSGVATGSAIQVQQGSSSQDGTASLGISASASDTNGDLALIWTNSSGFAYLDEFNSAGSSLIAQTPVPSAYSLAIDSEGDLAMTWLTEDGNNYDVNAQQYRNFASIEGASFVVQTSVPATEIVTSAGTYVFVPTAIAMDSSGNIQVSVAISTTAFNGTSYVNETYLATKTYGSTGTLTDQFQTTGGVGTVRDFPSLCDDAAGDFILVDTANSTAFGGSVQAQVFQAFSSTAAITGNIWNDSNANGIDDPTESSASLQSVNLYNSYGVLISTVASPSGSYSFTQVMPGQAVYVQVVPVETIVSWSTGPVVTSAGLITAENAGANPATNSVFDPASGNGPVVTLSAGQTLNNQNVGVTTSATITGSVFNDLLGTGVRDAVDPLVNGQTVFLDLNGNGTLDAGEPWASTNGVGGTPGIFELYLLRPGTYSLLVQPEPGWTVPAAQNVTVAAGQTVTVSIPLHESQTGVAPSQVGSAATLANSYTAPTVAMDDSGASVVVDPQSSSTIYFQRYSSTGAPVGSATQVASTGSTAVYATQVAMASDGSFVIVFDGSSGIFAQCYSAGGSPASGLFDVDNGGVGNTSAVAMNASGEFAVSWQQPTSSSGICQIYVRTFASGGTAISAPVPVALAVSSGIEISTQISANGSCSVVWNVQGSVNATSNIYAQWFNATATAVGDPVFVNPGSDEVDSYVSAAMNGAGELAIAWEGHLNNQLGLFVQRYSPDGTTLGNATYVMSTSLLQGAWKQIGIDSRGDVTGIVYYGEGGTAPFLGFYMDADGAASQFKVGPAASSYYYEYTAMASNSLGDFDFVYGIGASGPTYEVAYEAQPAVIDAGLETGPSIFQMTVRMSEDVTDLPTTSQVTVQDLTTATTVPTSVMSLASNSDGTVTLTFPGLANGMLSSGSYLIDVPAADVSTGAGRTLTSDFTYRFLWVAPDVTGDAVMVRRSSDGTSIQVFDQIPEGATPSYSAAITGLNQFSILGGGANDSLTLDISNGFSTPTSGLNYDGQGGVNSVQIIGTSASVSVTPTTIKVGTALVNLANVQSVTMTPGAANDSLSVSGGAVANIAAAPVGDGVILEKLYNLSIGTGSEVKLLNAASAGGASDHSDRIVLSVSYTSILGTLDTGDNDLILPINAFDGYTLTGYTQLVQIAGATGIGITSSTAAADPSHLTGIALMQSTGGTFDGQTTGTSSVLLKFSYVGDANLDGKVNASDYSLIDNGYLHHLTGWYNGDFNYDGVINGSDYTLIDNAYNMQGASLAAQIATSARAVKVVLRTAVADFAELQPASFINGSQETDSSGSIAAQIFGGDGAELLKRARFSGRKIAI